MDETVLTAGVLALGLAVVIAGTRATRARRRVRLGETGLMPWNSVMLIGMIAAVFAAAHLLTLWRG